MLLIVLFFSRSYFLPALLNMMLHMCIEGPVSHRTWTLATHCAILTCPICYCIQYWPQEPEFEMVPLIPRASQKEYQM